MKKINTSGQLQKALSMFCYKASLLTFNVCVLVYFEFSYLDYFKCDDTIEKERINIQKSRDGLMAREEFINHNFQLSIIVRNQCWL